MDSIDQILLDIGSKKAKKGSSKIKVRFADTIGNGVSFTPSFTLDPAAAKEHAQSVMAASPLVKSVMNSLDMSEPEIQRLALERDPKQNANFAGVWRRKNRLLPDEVLKRIAVQDDLVAAIINTRSQMLSAFGRPRPDRFSTGFVIEAQPGITDKMSSAEKEQLQEKIQRAEALLLSCGQTKGFTDHEALTFSQYMFQQARNAVLFGRCATEVIWAYSGGERHFHSFRPIDAGTIYAFNPGLVREGKVIREDALNELERLRSKKLVPERYTPDSYAWVQVMGGTAEQVFTDEEVVVHNFYPVTDVELEGYPVTPLDTVIAAVTTHINITTHNKLYFQSGRAARGMLVFKTDELDERSIEPIRQQFMANINGVGNAWRMPIFAIGQDANVEWTPIDSGQRDMEFQYLSDTNARVILSAFQMSPEELPGYAHLSRGTNNQALSESNNEYKLEAHRDVGIRPLIAQFQNYVNEKLFPLIDPELAKVASIKFVGLDVDTAEKESARIQQDLAVHMSMDEVLDKVEKKPVGKAWGGQFLLNPQWQDALYKHRYVGEIIEEFFGVEGASKDPTLRYIRDPDWFTWQKMLMEQKQMEMQAQAQQQQPQQGQGQEQGELATAADQMMAGLSKSEAKLPPVKRELLARQRAVIAHTLDAFEAESDQIISGIVEETAKIKAK